MCSGGEKCQCGITAPAPRWSTRPPAETGDDRMQAPPEPSVDLELRDGTLIRVRPVQSDDKERLRAVLDELSPESRYLRFISPRNKLTQRELRYLTEVDWRTHQAWAAVDPNQPGEPGVGGARCVRLEEDNVGLSFFDASWRRLAPCGAFRGKCVDQASHVEARLSKSCRLGPICPSGSC